MTTLGQPVSRTQKMNTGADRKHQNMLPDYKKVDPTRNQKVETLRKNPSGLRQLGDVEVQNLMKQYGITDLSPTQSKQLGNSGMSISYNPSTGKYMLTK